MQKGDFRRIRDKIQYLFKDGFFHIITGNTLSKAISFISTIAIIRIISKQAYGNLVYADNLYSYVNILSGLGMSSALIIYCSREKNILKKTQYFDIAVKYGSIVQCIGVACVLIYYFFITSTFKTASDIIWALVLYPVGTYWISCMLAYMRADFQNKLFAKVSLLQTSVVFVCSVIFAFVLGAIGIAVARYLSIIVLILVSANYFRKNTKRTRQKGVLTREEKKAFLFTSISLLIMNMFSQLMISNESMLVNTLINDELITANYKTAILIPSQLIFITSSVAIYFFPKVAEMGVGQQVWRYSKKIGISITVLIALIIIVAIPISPFIIKVVFGSQYSDATALLKWFWVAYGINASIRMIPLNILPAIGKEKFNAVLSIVSCVVHFLIDYYCIIKYGVYGVAFASIIVYAVSGLIAWIYLRRVCLRP